MLIIFLKDFKDKVYKYLLRFSENLHICIAESKKIGLQSKKLDNLIKDHHNGNFRENKVSDAFKFYTNVKYCINNWQAWFHSLKSKFNLGKIEIRQRLSQKTGGAHHCQLPTTFTTFNYEGVR